MRRRKEVEPLGGEPVLLDRQESWKCFADEGYTVELPVERVNETRKLRIAEVSLQGHRLAAWIPPEVGPTIGGGTRCRFLLDSSFYPSFLDPRLRDREKGFRFYHEAKNEFSAKGTIVSVRGDWAVLDCGLPIACEQAPSYFRQVENQDYRRGLKVGDTIIETGILGALFVR